MTFKTGADAVMKMGKPVIVLKEEKLDFGVTARLLPTISAIASACRFREKIAVRRLLARCRSRRFRFRLASKIRGSRCRSSSSTPSCNVRQSARSKWLWLPRFPINGPSPWWPASFSDFQGPAEKFPTMSKIPYLNRFFRNTAFGRETLTVLVLVTPRIIGEPETAHVERLRNGIRAEDDGLFPQIVSKGADRRETEPAPVSRNAAKRGQVVDSILPAFRCASR